MNSKKCFILATTIEIFLIGLLMLGGCDSDEDKALEIERQQIGMETD